MRQVFNSNEQVWQAFNEQKQSYGRTQNIFFEHGIVYSYGYHYPLAYILKGGEVLINDKGWSNTTSKHIRKAIDKTNNRPQFFTSQIELNQVYEELRYLNKRLQRARKPLKYALPIKTLYEKFNENMAYFGGYYLGKRQAFNHLDFELVFYSDSSPYDKQRLTEMLDIFTNALKYLK